ncbi:type II secretion system protein GspG [Rhodothalassium salexigens]|uniref:type II secretion system major pseudopilin GspG n=1 Tax=Rhodothalassium salexigens TaxID=1086 RepID=UPI0019145A02|nr:type II secretion system major pseudopilin GspG [Rhodothalassium salexigens]MBK5911642.1 type II secretion system protein GspG [Rhodothalassium salexigens]MBK5920935.1 type II secretion system protein GspG [Rhodothalassium salexigens]
MTQNTHQNRPPRRHQRRGDRGVTLVELMVVLVILGLLATVVVVNVLPAQDTAMVTKARSDIASLESALKMYRLDNLSYPTTDQGLEALVDRPEGLAQPNRYRDGGYIDRLPADPWGNPYQYVRPGEHGAYDLYSTGADGRVGGDDLNADIGNWQDPDQQG